MLNRKQPLSRLGRKRIGGLEGGKEPVSTFGPILSPRPAPLLFFNVNLVVNLESLFADYRRFYDVRIGAAVWVRELSVACLFGFLFFALLRRLQFFDRYSFEFRVVLCWIKLWVARWCNRMGVAEERFDQSV